MKITIESTTQIIELFRTPDDAQGIKCRVWEGETEAGIKVQCLIPRVAAKDNQDLSQFERELLEQKPPFSRHSESISPEDDYMTAPGRASSSPTKPNSRRRPKQ